MTLFERVENIAGNSRKSHITLWNLSDIQWGNRLVDKPLLRKHIAQIRNDPYSRVILGGDNLDAVVMGDKRFTAAVLDPDIYTAPEHFDGILGRAVRTLADELKSIKHKIWAIGDGNHEVAGNKRCQTDISYALSEMLGGIPLIGYESCLFITLRQGGASSREYVLRFHHGSGGGSTKGGKLNRRLSKANDWEGVDAHLTGHVHDPVTGEQIRLVPHRPQGGTPRLLERPVLSVISGSYLKTRSVEMATDKSPFSSYSEQAEYGPVALGMRGVTMYARETKILEARPDRYFREEDILGRNQRRTVSA